MRLFEVNEEGGVGAFRVWQAVVAALRSPPPAQRDTHPLMLLQLFSKEKRAERKRKLKVRVFLAALCMLSSCTRDWWQAGRQPRLATGC